MTPTSPGVPTGTATTGTATTGLTPTRAPTLDITTFSLGSQGNVNSIAAGPDGNLWFTSFAQYPPDGTFGAATVGRVTMAGAVTRFPLPSARSAPSNITAGPDGNLWFVDRAGNTIGRITTSGMVTEFSLPTTSGQTTTELFGIASGLDGNLWFTWRRLGPRLDQARIGRITPSGAITAFPLSLPFDAVRGITSGPDGNLWFTAGGACTEPCHQPAITRITPSGTITAFPFTGSDAISSPYIITSGPDGNLWFAGAYGNVNLSMIGQITPSGVIKVFPLPCSNPQTDCLGAGSIAAGPDGALWFSGGSTNIGRSTTTGIITEYRASLADVVALGPDHALWVASGDKVGRVTR
jgi:streptogramin lyase